MKNILEMKMPSEQAQLQFYVINDEQLWSLLLCLCCQVFKSTTGEKLTEIQAHDDEVLCCTYSPDDRLLATCSSDRKVKVSVKRPGFSSRFPRRYMTACVCASLRCGMWREPCCSGSSRRNTKNKSTTVSSPTRHTASCWPPAPMTSS